MRHIKLVGLTALALLAVSLTSLAATATAALPEGLPIGTAAEPVTFTAKSGAGTLETLAGKQVICEADGGSGSFTSAKLGTFKVLFEKCKETEFGTVCTGLAKGEKEGTIATEGEMHLWYGELGKVAKEKVPAFVALLKPVHFVCAGGLVLVVALGCVAGLVLETNKLLKTVKIDFLKEAGTKGDADIPTVINEKNELIACELGSSFNEGSEESSAEITTEEATGFKKGAKEVTVLLDY